MVGIVETEVDKLTGKVDIIDYVAVVDCGTVVNPNLARIQAEGGIAQGIGMALYEDITYTEKGKMRNDSFLQYKIPTRLDVGNIRVEFESSYEQTGPFGAKSIGEIVINTPSPALAHAVYNATTVAAIGVAAHECGHAMQHAKGYVPLSIRSALVPVVNFGSYLSWPLIVIGLFINSSTGSLFLNAGLLLFSLVVLFQLVTLPVEIMPPDVQCAYLIKSIY